MIHDAYPIGQTTMTSGTHLRNLVPRNHWGDLPVVYFK